MDTIRRRFSAQDAVVGSMLILFGIIMLLHELDIIYLYDLGVRSVWHLWPFILVIIGIGKLVDAPTMYHIGKGIWWIFLGMWLYISIYHIYGLSFSETWPAILIAWGVSMMWESLTKNPRTLYKEEHYGKQ
ncbi:MAG: DUF5668 domain-containing protein [Bacteriovoracaceae bacterium]|nr:DUF5668 domain-containing protein [Bacteroidota bacterium]